MFEVHVSASAGAVRIALVGDLDSHTCTQLRTAYAAQIGESTVSEVVVDASELSFLDSSGIRELLEVRQDVAGNGGAFATEGVPPRVRRLLEIAGLIDVLGVR
jgi:anti-anti-sigma factor